MISSNLINLDRNIACLGFEILDKISICGRRKEREHIFANKFGIDFNIYLTIWNMG